ncbi:Cyclic nucleotide-binding domain-containing protein 2 [Paramecium bursaria]
MMSDKLRVVVSQQKMQKQERQKHQSILEKITDLWQLDSGHSRNINYQRILFILRQYSALRTNEQLEAVRHYLEENFEYINKFKEKLDNTSFLDLVREMNVEHIDKFKTVFRYGDSGKKMYFILQGEIGVFIPKSKYSEDQIYDRQYKTFDEIIKHAFSDYSYVASKKQGEVFGEIAIEQKVTRTATIVTKTDCTFAIITYDLFQRILSAFQYQITTQKLEFLQKIPIFQNWLRQHKLVLLNSLELINYHSGLYVYQRHMIDEHIYLVVTGEIELIEWEEVIIERTGSIPKKIQKQKIKGLIGPGQFFGEFEHSQNLQTRLDAARVRQPSTVYRIKYSQLLDFFKLFGNVQEFNDYVRVKQEIQKNLNKKFEKQIQVEETDLDIEEIKKLYYKKKRVQREIGVLGKKLIKIDREAGKAAIQTKINDLRESIDTLEMMRAEKYSILIPFKDYPYSNSGDTVKSKSKRQIQVIIEDRSSNTQTFHTTQKKEIFITTPQYKQHSLSELLQMRLKGQKSNLSRTIHQRSSKPKSRRCLTSTSQYKFQLRTL